MTYILGINAFHAESAAVLLKDGALVAAVEEERFTRVKHWAGFPAQSIARCLDIGGISGSDISHVAVSRNPRANLFEKVKFALSNRMSLSTLVDRTKNLRAVSDIRLPIAAALGRPGSRQIKIHFVEHHPCHLASAFFVSPFDKAAVCAVDGFGDFVSASTAMGEGRSFRLLNKVVYPHSLGVLYSAVTQYLGFRHFGDEFKVMGLAPYGRPAHVSELQKLVTLVSGGKFELTRKYFRHWNEGIKMEWTDGPPTVATLFTPTLEKLLGPARKPGETVTEFHEDIAHSLQIVYEGALFHLLNDLYARTRTANLCIAGGCAMNSVANGKIRSSTRFENLFVQPGAADNGTALGAAYYVWNELLGRPRTFTMVHGYWGPEYSQTAINSTLHEIRTDPRFTFTDCADEKELCEKTARLVANGAVVGWFQGRMEWGARALGNRSIIADPRRADMRDVINLKIKMREKFRPFAPSIAEEAINDYFEGASADPFMQEVYPVKAAKHAVIPAVTHVDGSGRIQSVSKVSNPRYHRLISAFAEITGVPVILNTSFNENEPIVDTPFQALNCFLRTKMDAIVLGTTIVRRN